MCLSTTTILPPNGKPKAVIFFCHGYSSSASFLSSASLYKLTELYNIAVVGLDYEGHGLSDGVYAYFREFDVIADDVLDYFREVVQNEFPDTPRFLLGYSMGAAVAYFVQRKCPSLFQNVIFISGMIQVKDGVRNEFFEKLLLLILGGEEGIHSVGILPVYPNRAPIPPKDPQALEILWKSPYRYRRKARLSTAWELLNAMIELTNTCHKFHVNCLILHGLDDETTCPKSSQYFYDVCQSSDKTLKLLDGMDHGTIFGETTENVSKVLAEVNEWIEARI